MEVPTVLSPLRIAEQIVGIPVPRGRGQGSLPGQSTTATHSSAKRISERIVEQIVDFPEQTVEQIVDISPGGGGLGLGSASSAGAADEDFTGFFSHFSPWKKVRSAGQVVSAQLGEHVSSSTLSAHQMARAGEPVDSGGSDVWVKLHEGDTNATTTQQQRNNNATITQQQRRNTTNTNTSTNTNNNNNNNTMWRGFVLIGEEPPPHSGELNHALSQVGRPTQSQLSRFMSSRHHISMEHRLWRKHLLLNPDINARSGIFFKKQEKHIFRKKSMTKNRRKKGIEKEKGKKEKTRNLKERQEKMRKKGEKRLQRGTSRDGSKKKMH